MNIIIVALTPVEFRGDDDNDDGNGDNIENNKEYTDVDNDERL